MKTVLVIGGSRGIGRETVRLFAERGYAVAFTYSKSEEEAKAVAKETGALALKADSLCEAEIVSAVQRTLGEFGHIDVLVNNAAVSGFSLLTDLSLEEWNRILGVTLTGSFLYCREVLPDMIRRHSGRIVNVSSMWGTVGASCEVHYSAAKAGLVGLTKALAKEVGPSGITVNAVAPGVIDTDMNRALTEEDKAALMEETPLGRLGTPREIAESVYFLAAESASFITGQVLGVNGGFVI